jgi:hypothetical protein
VVFTSSFVFNFQALVQNGNIHHLHQATSLRKNKKTNKNINIGTICSIKIFLISLSCVYLTII